MNQFCNTSVCIPVTRSLPRSTNPVPILVTVLRQLSDHYRIMQLTEEMISGTSASRTSALVTALVQFIIRYDPYCVLVLKAVYVCVLLYQRRLNNRSQQLIHVNFEQLPRHCCPHRPPHCAYRHI